VVGERFPSERPPRPERGDFCRRPEPVPRCMEVTRRPDDAGGKDEAKGWSANASRASGRRGPSEETFAAAPSRRHTAWRLRDVRTMQAQKTRRRGGRRTLPERAAAAARARRLLPPPRAGATLHGGYATSGRCRRKRRGEGVVGERFPSEWPPRPERGDFCRRPEPVPRCMEVTRRPDEAGGKDEAKGWSAEPVPDGNPLAHEPAMLTPRGRPVDDAGRRSRARARRLRETPARILSPA